MPTPRCAATSSTPTQRSSEPTQSLLRQFCARKSIIADESRHPRTLTVKGLPEQVEVEVGKLYAHIAETVRTKEAELGAEERRIANLVDFIGRGAGARPSPRRWSRPSAGSRTCEKSWTGSAAAARGISTRARWSESGSGWPGCRRCWSGGRTARRFSLRSLLGQIRLALTRSQVGRPATARTSLDALALLAPSPDHDGTEDGSASLQRWTPTALSPSEQGRVPGAGRPFSGRH